MSSIEQRRNLEKVTTSDFSSGGLLNRQQFDEFFLEVQDSAQVLDTIRFQPVTGDQAQIDKLGVGERLIRSATEATSGTLQTPNTGSIDIDTVKIELPWEVSMETVEDTIEQEGTADRLVDLFAQQFAVDSEDLAFNGDEDDTSGGASQAFLTINDGFLVKADDSADPATYDHQSAAVNKEVFHELITGLPEKYRRDPTGLAFFTSLSQKQAYKDYLTDRSTGAGDSMLMSGEEPTPYGYPVLTPTGFPDDRVMLTNPRNLVWAVQRDVNMRVTQEGEAVVRRDLYAIYNMLARTDYVIEDLSGVATASNVAAP